MASISERTFLLQKEWKDIPLPISIYERVKKLPAILRIPDRILISIAPQHNAVLWIIINASQVMLSFFILLALLSVIDVNREYEDGDADIGGVDDSTDSYAQQLAQQLEISYEQHEEIIVTRVIERFDIYNLITLSIWIVQIGTSLWLSSRNRDRLTYAQFIEFCFALIFSGHSIYYVLPNHEHHRRHSVLLANVCTKMVAYSFAFLFTLKKCKEQQEKEVQEVAWWEDISIGATTVEQRSRCGSIYNENNRIILEKEYEVRKGLSLDHT